MFSNGNAVFEFEVVWSVNQTKEVWTVDERHILAWEKDEFEAFIQNKATKQYLHIQQAASHGDVDQMGWVYAIADVDNTEYVIQDIRLVDMPGTLTLLTFDGIAQFEEELQRRYVQCIQLGRLHGLDVEELEIALVGIGGEVEIDEGLRSSEPEPEPHDPQPKDEVVLPHMTEAEVAQRMFREIRKMSVRLDLTEDAQAALAELGEAMDQSDYVAAKDRAAEVRVLFNGCTLKSEFEGSIGSVAPKGYASSRGETFEWVDTPTKFRNLVSTRGFIQMNLIPKEFIPEENTDVDQNVVYVPPKTADAMCEFNKILRRFLKAEQKIQLGVDFERCHPLCFLPNSIIYHVRGDENLDYKIHVW